MDKRKKLSLGNNLALCFIAIISIVIAIGAASLFYYFDKYVDVSHMSVYYQNLKLVINVIFTLVVVALLVHIQYKVLGKTLFKRMDMKKNALLKQSAYWIISVILGIIVIYLFDSFVEKYDKYFLFMLLAIIEVCDIVANYMIDEFDVNNEEVSLAYLMFAVMISVCCYMVFNFSNILIEGKILARHNSEKQFCIVTKNLLSKIDSNNIIDLKEYVNRINSIKDNKDLITECANYIDTLPDVIDDAQLEQLKDTLGKMSNNKDEYKIEENYIQEKEELRKALTIEGLLIFFISLIAFVISVQIKKTLKEAAMKKGIDKKVKEKTTKEKIKKVVEKEPTKEEVKKVVEKEEVKKGPKKTEVKKVVEKEEVKKEPKKTEVKKVVKKEATKKTATKKKVAKKKTTKK